MERKALLLRVGIDRGTGGTLAPIFADGSFEYVPIPEMETTAGPITFAKLPARCERSLTAFLPHRLHDRPAHVDPDFVALTYGDAAPHKRRQLLRLKPGDILVFYAGFEPWPRDDIPRLFAVGWFEVKTIRHLRALQIATDKRLQARFGRTAHFLRDPPDSELALVEGKKRHSRFLQHALPLGDGEDRLLRDLVALGYRGSLRRAVGHWLRGSAVAALDHWLREGPVSLIAESARVFSASTRALHLAQLEDHRGDLVIDDPRPAIGDWVFAYGSDVVALARINERIAKGRTCASLFWYLQRTIQPPLDRRPVLDLRGVAGAGGAPLRDLVSWMASHYRIGIHSSQCRRC